MKARTAMTSGGACAIVAILVLLALPPVSPAVHAAAAGAPAAAPSPFLSSRIPAAPVPVVGTANDTWNRAANASNAFAPRSLPAIASDPGLDGVVLFGGYDPVTFGALGDTWLFTNGSWQDLTPLLGASPPARWGGTMSYDAHDGALVLYGGRTPSGTLNDTWTLTAADVAFGAGWSQVALTSAPPAEALAASFYDPSTSSVILFGGGCVLCSATSTWTASNQTWSYSGGNWTNETTAAGSSNPGPLFAGFSAWDPDLDGGLFYGGDGYQNNCSSVSNSTWLYNGTWSELTTHGAPGTVVSGGMAWYGLGDEMVLFGGLGPSPKGCRGATETSWVLRGANWTDVTNASGADVNIGQRCCVGVAYDPSTELVVMTVGNNQGATYFNSTWTYPTTPFVVAPDFPTRGYANVTAFQFRSNATGGAAPYAYRWSFGDGSANATTQNATHVYSAAGTYTVVYYAQDAAGREFNATSVVVVAVALNLTASASGRDGDAPYAVQFNASATGGFRPYTWLWHFGDGFTWDGANVTHTYSIEGTFHAYVLVSDSNQANLTYNFTIVVHGRLIASIAPSASSVITPGPVAFSSILKGGGAPFDYLWTFAPGATNTSQNANYTFATPGTYNVTLNVSDGDGYRATTWVVVDAYAPLHASALASAPLGVAPLIETFTALPVDGAPPLYFTWNFGDGSPTVPGLTTTHPYLQAGNYTVRLTVVDALGESVNTTVPVRLVPALFVVASANVTQGASPLAVRLTATTSGGLAPLTLHWSFGDGGTAIGADATHTFTNGSFYAQVSATDALGENVSSGLHVLVYDTLAVTAAASPPTLILGNVTTLAATIRGGLPPTILDWHGLPPGCLSRDAATIDCLATSPGVYNITVNASDAAHENATAALELQVMPVITECCSPGPSGSGAANPTWELVAAGVGGAAIVGLVAWVVIRRRGPPPEPTPRSDEPGAPDDG